MGFDGGGVNVSLTMRLGFAWTASDGELGGRLVLDAAFDSDTTAGSCSEILISAFVLSLGLGCCAVEISINCASTCLSALLNFLILRRSPNAAPFCPR